MASLHELIRRARRWKLNDDAVLAIAVLAGSAVGLIAKFWGLPE